MSDLGSRYRGFLQSALDIDTAGLQSPESLAVEFYRRVILNGTKIAANGTVTFGLTSFFASPITFTANALVTFNGGFISTGNTVLGNTIVNGLLTANGGLIVNGTFNANGSLLTSLNASALMTGTVPTPRLGSGVANSSTFLAGDQTYQSIVIPVVVNANTTANGLVSIAAQIFAGDKTFNGNTTFGGYVNVASFLQVTGNAAVTGNLQVAGISLTGNIVGGNHININVVDAANGNFGGYINVGTTLQVAGNTSLANCAIANTGRMILPVGTNLY